MGVLFIIMYLNSKLEAPLHSLLHVSHKGHYSLPQFATVRYRFCHYGEKFSSLQSAQVFFCFSIIYKFALNSNNKRQTTTKQNTWIKVERNRKVQVLLDEAKIGWNFKCKMTINRPCYQDTKGRNVDDKK